MITCIINGHRAYPISTSSIKVTYANQYVTDDGEYTYDITFPMDILANREIFKNVSRFEVAKNIAKYDDCKLYVDSRIIMSGVGTILSVNQKEVKLQIVGGKSRIKFNEKLTKHYIDELDLGIADAPGQAVEKRENKFSDLSKVVDIYTLSVDKSEFLGREGRWCYMPTYDETNELIANFVGVDRRGYFVGQKTAYLQNAAVQPNLMYIFKRIVELEGYKLIRNDYDCKPWNKLYIASAFKSRELRRALPHWSAYTFIENFRKFFNASIFFDEIQKTCSVISSSEMSTADSVEIEPLDEYSTDYDEDGSFSTSSTANLEYKLDDSVNRGSYESISKKVFSNFETVKSFEIFGESSQFAATTAFWSEKEKRQTIIENFGSYYIYVEEDNAKTWQLAGYWSPLIRDKDSDDYVDLCISPAAQLVSDVNFRCSFLEDNYTEKRCMLSITNSREADAKNCDTDEEGLSYVSVQDAIDDESTMDDSEADEEVMSVFFILSGKVQAYDKPYGRISWVGEKSRWPMFMTDYRINDDYRYVGVGDIGDIGDNELYSLSLNATNSGSISLAKFHDSVIKIDNRNCMEVKFKSDDIPDPSKIYIIRNKRFVCEKIEMEVKDDAIEPIYTGYFYMLS